MRRRSKWMVGVGLLLLVASVVTLLYALTTQFVIEGTSSANYDAWAARPLVVCAALAVLLSAGAVVTIAARRATRWGRVALGLCGVALVTGWGTFGVRHHPVGPERSIAASVRLPGAYDSTEYRPKTGHDVGPSDPPSLVRTSTAAVPAAQACADGRAALVAAGAHILHDTRGPNQECILVATKHRWPIVLQVDQPTSSRIYGLPPRAGSGPLPPVPQGLVRVDLWVQPPDWS